MDKIKYTSSEDYPVLQTVNFNGEEIDISNIDDFSAFASKTASDRLLNYTRAKHEKSAAAGDLNPDSDPFLADLVTVIHQYMTARATLEAIAAGLFPSTEKNPQYAGNIVSEGNRLFTPQEAARNAMDSINNL